MVRETIGIIHSYGSFPDCKKSVCCIQLRYVRMIEVYHRSWTTRKSNEPHIWLYRNNPAHHDRTAGPDCLDLSEPKNRSQNSGGTRLSSLGLGQNQFCPAAFVVAPKVHLDLDD